MPFLAAVKEAKLRTFVTPGQLLALTAEMIHDGSGYAMTQAQVVLDGKAICDAHITFRIMDFPSPDFRDRMQDWAKRLEFPAGALAHG